MEEQSRGTNRVSKIRRTPCRITKELWVGRKVNERSTEKYEEAIQQEKMKFSKIESWRQCMVREQEYPIELTLKEVRPKII